MTLSPVRRRLIFLSLTMTLGLVWMSGCSSSKSDGESSTNTLTQSDRLIGSWTNRDKTRFLEITSGGSVVVHRKGESDEDIGFFEVDGSSIRIFKDRGSATGRTEVSRFELISDDEVVFGENSEYWNVINISGRWYREGTDINKVVAEKKLKQLSPEERKLVEVRVKIDNCQQLLNTLEGDRQSYLVKISRIDEKKQADSWKLNASMLAKTKKRIQDAQYELKKLQRAEELLDTLVADRKRSKDIAGSGLDDEGLKDILRSIGQAESKLPIENETSDFTLKSMVEEELKEFQSRKSESSTDPKDSDSKNSDPKDSDQ